MGRRVKQRQILESNLAADSSWEKRDAPWNEPISEALFSMHKVTRQLGHSQRVDESVNDGWPLLLRRQDAATTVTIDDPVTVAVEVNGADQPTMTVSLSSVSSDQSFPSDLALSTLSAAPTTSLSVTSSDNQI